MRKIQFVKSKGQIIGLLLIASSFFMIIPQSSFASVINIFEKSFDSAEKTFQIESGKYVKQITSRIFYAFTKVETWLKARVGFNVGSILGLIKVVFIAIVNTIIIISKGAKHVLTNAF
jgi:hypothetical protein